MTPPVTCCVNKKMKMSDWFVVLSQNRILKQDSGEPLVM